MPRRSAQEQTYGQLAVLRAQGDVYEQPLKQLRGRKGIEIYTEMYYIDPVIGAIMFAIENTMRRAQWRVELPDKSNLMRKCGDYLESNKDDMHPARWDDFIADSLLFLPYGWSLFETTYKMRKGDKAERGFTSKFNDGKVGIKSIDFRSQRSFDEWDFDERTNEVRGMRQYIESMGEYATIPFEVGRDNVRKVVHFKTKPAGGNPEGISIFTNAYRPWAIKKRLEEVEGIGIERDLNGLPVLIPPEEFDWDDEENNKALPWARKLVTHIRKDEYMGVILPNGKWNLKLLSATGTRQHNTSEVINRYDKRIAMTAIAQFIMLGMDRVGSFALVKSMSDLWFSAIEGHMYSMENTINRDIRDPLLMLDPEFEGIYKGMKQPRFVADRINVPDITELANFVNVIAAHDVIDLKDPSMQNALLRAGRLPEMNEERFEERVKEHEEELEQQKEMAKQALKQAKMSANGNAASGSNGKGKGSGAVGTGGGGVDIPASRGKKKVEQGPRAGR